MNELAEQDKTENNQALSGQVDQLVIRHQLKPFMVEIRTYGVVMAFDDAHAAIVAEDHKYEIFVDDCNPYIEVEGEIKTIKELEHGWDGECIPYGADGNTKLETLLTYNKRLTRPG